MIRQDFNRIDAKRRNVVDHRKKQFAEASYKEPQYPHRLNFYATPPTADITLEQFEQWAIDRLRSGFFRVQLLIYIVANISDFVQSSPNWKHALSATSLLRRRRRT